MRCGRRGDEGSVLLLTLGLVAVLVALLLTVAAASQVFLARRSLVAATDAAALAGAQAADLDVVYSGDGTGEGEAVPLDRRAARDAVADHVERARLDDRFDDFEVVSVTVDDGTVTVRTRARVRLVLAGPITDGRSAVEVRAESAARSRIR